MNHKEFMGQLTNCKNNFIINIAGMAVMSDPSAKPILKSSHCSFGGFSISFEQVVPLLENPKDMNIAFKEAILSSFRALLKESFELVNTYAEVSNQGAKFRNFSCYRFHRLVRNAISHNFLWSLQNSRGNFYNYLPLDWHGVVVRQSMHNQPVRLEHFPFPAMWQLFVELQQEAGTKLS